MEREGGPNAPASASSPFLVTCHPRDLPFFRGLRGDDVEDWLEQYNRVSQFNRWGDGFKLQNVGFYLSQVAETWYLNHKEKLTDWATFTEEIRKIFGVSSARSDVAKKKLETRMQHPD